MYDMMALHEDITTTVKSKCRPTMTTHPPYYVLFIVFARDEEEEVHWSVPGAHCFCPTGLSQSCVHVSAVLLTLVEISPVACASLLCVWSKPCGQAKHSLMRDLLFGSNGITYATYTGPSLDPKHLLDAIASVPGGENAFKLCLASSESNRFRLLLGAPKKSRGFA